jgi:hypothetical protein
MNSNTIEKPKTQSLYSITGNFETLLDMREELLSEGQDKEETAGHLDGIDAALEITQEEFREKALNYAKFIQSEALSIDCIDAEIKRLQGLKKSKINKIDKLKTSLSDAMKTFGFDKFDLGIFKLSFRKSSSVEILEGAIIPDEFKRVIPESFSPDKAALKKALEAGESFEGISISSNSSLQIK